MKLARYFYFCLVSLVTLYSSVSLSQMVVLGQDDGAESIEDYRAFIDKRLQPFSMDLSMREFLMDASGSRMDLEPTLRLVKDRNLSRHNPIQPTPPFSVCVLGTDSYSEWWLKNLVLASDMPEAEVCLVLGADQQSDLDQLNTRFSQVLFVPISGYHFTYLFPSVEHYPIVLIEADRPASIPPLVAGIPGN